MPQIFHEGCRAAGFRGVKQVAYRRWRAEINFAGRVHLIRDDFTAPEEAAVAYDQVAVRMFGGAAMTNFPLGNYLLIGEPDPTLPDTLIIQKCEDGRPPEFLVQRA